MVKKEILGIEAPENVCTDRKCPFHGQINVKPELVTGRVVKKDVNKSVTLEWFRQYYIPKYERYEIRRSRIRAYNPPCFNVELGWTVLAARTRPLSKTKNHVIIKVLSKEVSLPLPEDEEEQKKKTKVKKA